MLLDLFLVSHRWVMHYLLSGLKWVVMLAPLGIVFYMSFGINKMSASKAQTVFWIFAAFMGLSLSWILLVYTGEVLTRVFL